jgi:hypothetical protein
VEANVRGHHTFHQTKKIMKLKKKIIEQLKKRKKRKDYRFIIVISCVYVSCVTIGIAIATSSPISVSFVIVM